MTINTPQANGNHALVTGAAGSIGQALVSRLIDLGYDVFLLDINAAGLEAAARPFGGKAHPVICDLADPASIGRALETVTQQTSRLQVIINNAGVIIPGPFITAKAEAIEKQMQINLLGPMRILNTFLPLVSAGGSVINIVSMGGILPLADSAVYTAGKFGLRGLTNSLSLELRERGIKVSGIYPSAVDTPMLQFEALNGGSVLNFISDPLPPAKVADLAMRALREGKVEYYTPYSDSILARIFGNIPWLIPYIVKHFEKKGAAGLRKYLADRKLG